jgi:predicted nucleic acid-binding protein
LALLRKLEVDSLANVLEIAIERYLAYYDASYIYLAKKKKLKLVTANNDLLKKCKAAIPIDEMK